MLEVKNLTKIYKTKGDNKTIALNSVSIKFPENGMVFLLGKSGSGKSTLLNVAGGLDTPTSGEILIKGRSSQTFKGADFDSYRNTFVGFIFQEYNILNEFSVEDNIAIALQLQGKPKDKKKIAKLLDDVDLSNFAKRKPNTLSGGQKQRIAIARALVKDPEIIMADEPTGALDSSTGKQVLDTLKKLSKTKLVIIVSHDREFAEIYGDRIIELKDGVIINDVTKGHSIPKEEGNITVVDDGTLVIKEGKTLDTNDLQIINNFLKSSNKEIILSNNENDVKKYKKEARISDDFSKETFDSTDESQISSKTYTKEEQKLIRSKLPMRHSTKIGLSNLKLKPFRLLSTILLSCVSFILLGTVSTMMFYKKDDVAASSLKNANYKFLNIRKQYQYEYSYDYDGKERKYTSSCYTLFSDEDLEKYKEKYGKSAIANFSIMENNIEIGNSQSFYSQININNVKYRNNDNSYYSTKTSGFIDDLDNNIIKNRLKLGAFPTSEDEVAISSFTAESLINFELTDAETNINKIEINSISDLIGKKIVIDYCNPLTITGIFDCDDLIDSKFKKLKEDENVNGNYSLKNEWQQEIQNGLIANLLVSKDFYKKNKQINIIQKYVYLYENNTNFNFHSVSKFRDAIDFYSLSGEKLNSLPTDGAYLTFSDYYSYIENLINNLESKSEEFNKAIELRSNLEEQKISEEEYLKQAYDLLKNTSNFGKLNLINDYDQSEITLDLKGYCTVNNFSTIFVNDNVYNSIASEYMDASSSQSTKYNIDQKARYKNLYIDTSSFSLSDYKKLVSSNNIVQDDYSSILIENELMNSIELADTMIKGLKAVFLWTGIVLGVFATLLLCNFITISISNKKREIGILRAVGAKGSDVFKIFFSESLTIVFICFVLSLIGTSFVCSSINSSIGETMHITLFVISFKTVLLIFVLALIVSIFGTFLPVWSIARKKPVEAIKSI